MKPSTTGDVVVYGGYATSSVSAYLGTLESYNPLLDTWTTKAPGVARTEVGIAVNNGLMYAFGGNNAQDRTLDTAAAYDSASDTWAGKTAMPVGSGFARAENGNGKIDVFGTNSTLEYTPANDVK